MTDRPWNGLTKFYLGVKSMRLFENCVLIWNRFPQDSRQKYKTRSTTYQTYQSFNSTVGLWLVIYELAYLAIHFTTIVAMLSCMIIGTDTT